MARAPRLPAVRAARAARRARAVRQAPRRPGRARPAARRQLYRLFGERLRALPAPDREPPAQPRHRQRRGRGGPAAARLPPLPRQQPAAAAHARLHRRLRVRARARRARAAALPRALRRALRRALPRALPRAPLTARDIELRHYWLLYSSTADAGATTRRASLFSLTKTHLELTGCRLQSGSKS